MPNSKYPLYMEFDRTPASEDGRTIWTVPAKLYDPQKGQPANGRSVPLNTIGDTFRYVQGLLDSGWRGNPRPTTAEITDNPVMMWLGSVSAKKNAADFGIDKEGLLAPGEEFARDSSILHHWQHHRWNHNGRIIYDLNEALAQAFLQTDLTVLPSDLTLPETTCYIAVPRSLGFKVWHVLTGEHVLDGFYATLTDQYLYVVACGFAHEGCPSYDNALATFVVDRTRGGTVQEWLDLQRKDPVSVRIMGPNADNLVAWSNIVVNALLYIDHVREDVQHIPNYGVPPKKLAHAEKIPGPRARQKFLDSWRSPCRYHVLGEQAEATLRTESPPGDSNAGPMARHLVRGHWRQQPHGPNRSLRKLLWIQPFWKGVDTGEQTPVTHIVKVV